MRHNCLHIVIAELHMVTKGYIWLHWVTYTVWLHCGYNRLHMATLSYIGLHMGTMGFIWLQ